jgi:transcriptional regulator with XRE-family HTH domain
MDILVDEPEAALARRIRFEREGRGWSLADLAGRSGVSRAAISKIERGAMSPTAGLLVRIAGAFDLTLAGLLVRAESAQGRLSRSHDQPQWQDPATGYQRRQIFVRPDHPIEIVLVTLPAGAEVALPASSYAHIRQAIWLVDGRLTLEEGGERFELEPGDCLGFGPPGDVVFANRTDQPCRYLVTLTRS